MILVDFSQLAISSIAVATKGQLQMVNQHMVRHVLLNCLKSYYKKFKYGPYTNEMILCCDGRHAWRRDVFKYYKQNRAKSKETSPIDWKIVYALINTFLDELHMYFPYKIVSVDRAEADDVIAVLVKNFPATEHVIVSNDHDFFQLHSPKVCQYLPLKKQVFREKTPDDFLHNHILEGDKGDGIPNILSDDDVFVAEDKRQVPFTQNRKKMINDALTKKVLKPDLSANYMRNKMLIDFTAIPPEIEKLVLDKYYNAVPAGRDKLLQYLWNHKLMQLVEEAGEF